MKTIPVTLALLMLSTAGTAQAKDAFQVLVCYPGGGTVKAKQAKPAMDKMLGVLQEMGGWSAGTFQHEFTTKVEDCRKLMDSTKPAFVITSLGLFLEHRKAHGLLPLASPTIEGRTTETYRVLVKKGSFSDLAGLKGKTMGGSLLTETAFLKRVVFQNEVDPAAHFQLKPSKRALRALRKLAKGKLDAVLVNEQQFSALKALPFSKDLVPVFASQPLPQIGLAAAEKRCSAEDRKRLTNALSKMCTHADGKSVCEMFGLDTFSPADPKTYQAVIELWNKG